LKLVIATSQPLENVSILAQLVNETVFPILLAYIDEGSNQIADVLMLVTDDGFELCVDRFAKELSLALVIRAADPFYRHPEIVATF
jgi:hypothetical protein